MLLLGISPFNNEYEILNRDIQKHQNFSSISETAQDFLLKSLNRDIKSRYSAKQLLNH